MNKLLNMKQISEYIGISYDTVKSWKKQNLIPHLIIGSRPYFLVESVERWLNKLEDQQINTGGKKDGK